jgi:hypothetical protein
MKPTHIIVVESGWVFAAVLESTEGDISAAECCVIRNWGTTNGLGQLALKGPTSSTKLDRCNATHIPREKVLFFMECSGCEWPLP